MSGIRPNLLKVGCCGFPVGRPKYFEKFEVVEVQQSFYELPHLRTAEKWKQEAPAGFEYTAKVWQLITHEPKSPTYRRLKLRIDAARADRFGSFKPTSEAAEAWEKFLAFARVLGVEKVIFQCPAGFRPLAENKNNIERFFSSIDRAGLTCIWEPRGDWKVPDIIEICERCKLIHCTDPFHSTPQDGPIQYFRLHGITGYRYRFSEEDFRRLLEKIDPARLCYIMFNNVMMFEDAVRFRQTVEKESARNPQAGAR